MTFHRLLLGAACVLLTSCSARIGDLTLMTTKNLGVTPKPLRQSVRGADCSHVILFIPIGSLNPNLDEAMDRALAQVPEGNGLTDMSIHQDILFTYLYNRTCVRVDGNVVLYK